MTSVQYLVTDDLSCSDDDSDEDIITDYLPATTSESIPLVVNQRHAEHGRRPNLVESHVSSSMPPQVRAWNQETNNNQVLVSSIAAGTASVPGPPPAAPTAGVLKNRQPPAGTPPALLVTRESGHNVLPEMMMESSVDSNRNVHLDNGMGGAIPTISITQHSPAASKAYLVLEDDLRHLHAIQDSIHRMREVNARVAHGQLDCELRKTLSASCPSLCQESPEAQEISWLDSPSPPTWEKEVRNDDATKRRRSWTGFGDKEKKHPLPRRQRSISLSSLETDGEGDNDDGEGDLNEERHNNDGVAASSSDGQDVVDGWTVRNLLHSKNNNKPLAKQSTQSLSDYQAPLVLEEDVGLRDRGGTNTGLVTDREREGSLTASSSRLTAGFGLGGFGAGLTGLGAIARLSLQKSISTPSILAVQDGARLGGASVSRSGLNTGPTSEFIALARYAAVESETEDELIPSYLDQRSSLAELIPDPSYTEDDDQHTKRRKRGSLFFKKRKDKDKGKKSSHQFVSVCHSNSQLCDVCAKPLTNKAALHCENCMVNVHESSCKDQVSDCAKFRVPKATKPTLPLKPTNVTLPSLTSSSSLLPHNGPPPLPRKPSLPTPTSTTKESTPVVKVINEEKEAELPVEEAVNNVLVETMLDSQFISIESLEDGRHVSFFDLHADAKDRLGVSPADIKDLDLDPELGVLDEEPEAWVGTVERSISKKMKDKDVKRQEHIYEFIMTEKHHCLTLKVMQKVFAEGMRRELNYPSEILERLFPCLDELLDYHLNFLRRLRRRQRQECVVSSLEDILRTEFSGALGDQLRSLYGEFCSRHKEAVSLYKDILKEDRKFQAFVRQCSLNPLCKKKGIPECILFVTQRITKYPLLIDPLIKTSRDNKEECNKLQEVLAMVKDILIGVNAQVAEKERKQRLLEIYNKIDAKSATLWRNKKFKKSDLLSSNRRLMFEGVAYLNNARGKVQLVTVVVLSDVVFFLQESNQKFHFVTQDTKAGVVSLQKLLVREKAGQDSRSIYLISSNPAEPEMYELQCQNPRDKKLWIDTIRSAVECCPEDENVAQNDSEEQRKLMEARSVKLRELLSGLKDKDRELAQILEAKMQMLGELVEAVGVGGPEEAGFALLGQQDPPKYSSLVVEPLDIPVAKETTNRALQEAHRLSCIIYGHPSANLARSVSSAGEKHSEAFSLPSLPRRAETFGGFDNPTQPNPSLLQTKLGKKKLEASDQSYSSKNSDSPIMMESMDWSCQSLSIPPSPTSSQAKEQYAAGLHLTHHLNTLMCIVSSQQTVIESLKAELIESRTGCSSLNSHPKHSHNQRLEELRNLQDKFSQEKAEWLREKAAQEETFAEQSKQLHKLQEQLKTEQADIKQQRENLYQKLEALKSQGIILSPTMTVVGVAPPLPQHDEPLHHQVPSSTSAALNSIATVSPNSVPVPNPSPAGLDPRRKPDPPKKSLANMTLNMNHHASTASLTTKKENASNLPLPSHLLSATNQQKAVVTVNNVQVKQQLPMKLAKLGNSSSQGGGATSPQTGAAGHHQLLPLRLSENLDKKSPKNSSEKRLSSNSFSPPTRTEASGSLTMTHMRTGSSPAAIIPQYQPRLPVAAKPALIARPEMSSAGTGTENIVQVQRRVHDPETNQDILFF